jgi:GNAT superfamily N-acetyltransferase
MARHASELATGDKVFLWREHLEGIPQFALPHGFSLRWFQPDDEEHWFRIQTAADRLNEITPELFQRQFGTEQRPLADRQCYLLDSSRQAIGTGTAWFNDNFEGRSFGRVHWLAVLPESQGRGLAKPLMTAICSRLRELGHERAYLTTSTARLVAIKLYFGFGFVPLIRNEWEESLWRGIEDKLAGNFARNFSQKDRSNK